MSWFDAQLDQAVADVERLRNEGYDIALDISIYVTSGDVPTSETSLHGNVTQSGGRTEYIDEKLGSDYTRPISISSSSYSLQKHNAGICILSGRPDVPNIIRDTAEQALGEMAVVVCGPPGLVQGTRNAAVEVANDRAVHKGTGAQGIYVHAEAFGYA